MIEWLFSLSESQAELRTMATSVQAAVKSKVSRGGRKSLGERGKEPSLTTSGVVVLVGVACSTGAQLSVCVVERLYDHFRWESPLEGVAVERSHWDVFQSPWGTRGDFVWQYYPLTRAARKRTTIDLERMCRNDRFLWVNFSPQVGRTIETAFRENPLASSVEIPDGVVNFESSFFLDRDSNTKFPLRCSVPSEARQVRSWLLGHRAYLTTVSSFCGAGIFPYSVHPATGEPVCLLGRITYGYQAWCDFGGLKGSREQPRYTAARECYEETLGVLGKTKHLMGALENFAENNAFKVCVCVRACVRARVCVCACVRVCIRACM